MSYWRKNLTLCSLCGTHGHGAICQDANFGWCHATCSSTVRNMAVMHPDFAPDLDHLGQQMLAHTSDLVAISLLAEFIARNLEKHHV
jgi:hypothetical protein